jgi:lactate permease
MTILALLPILVLLVLVVLMAKPTYKAGPISLVLTIIVATVGWGVESSWILAALTRGSLITAEIVFLLLGVFLTTAILKKAGAFLLIDGLISKLSDDIRVQVILVGWFLVAFMEGIAGFGTPTMVSAPLMLALGISPLVAITTALLADGVAVTFGAVGLPMTIGIAQGVTESQAQLLGPDFLTSVYITTAAIHAVLGIFVPLAILAVASLIYDQNLRRASEAWKLAIFAGVSFTLPYLFIAVFIGPEFPSVIGSLIGGLIFIVGVRKNLFNPSQPWLLSRDRLPLVDRPVRDYVKALVPYTAIIVLLLLTRLPVSKISDAAKSVRWGFDDLFGTGLNFQILPLASPGFIFLLGAGISFLMFKIPVKQLAEALKDAGKRGYRTAIALISIIGMVNIMLYSASNAFGYPSMANQIVHLLAGTKFLWPLFSPFVGLFGAFLAGSSTVSNLMFSSVQVDVSLAVGFSPVLALVLQSIGSAAGNMVAVHNIIAATAVVRLPRAEGKVIKYNIIPALVYSLLAGVIGLLLGWAG